MTLTLFDKEEIFFSENPEKEYTKITPQTYRKKLAQFFTPYPVAQFMAKWILSNPNCKTVLDPALGLGIFFRAILHDLDKEISFKGYDIDEKVLERTKKIFENFENIEILNQDYMFNDWENAYDGIICNPPYFKFKDYSTKESILTNFENRLGFNLNGFTNIYTLFLLKSIHQLNENGRCAYLIPSEFLNSDYGTHVKKYLIENKFLRYIIIFDFKEPIFADVLTTSSIFLFAKDNEKSEVEFINITSQNDLENIIEKINTYPKINFEKTKKIEYKELNPDIKWRFYYQPQNTQKYQNLIPFKTYAKVVRGIATGDNNYFSFNIEKKEKFNINEKNLMPCIMRAIDVEGCFFTENDFINLKEKNKKIYLFNATNLEDSNVDYYIRLGKQTGASERFLTSKRTPWYALENRPSSPIWVGVFNRTGLRFVRNEANIKNLTAFHCVYLTPLYEQNIDLFFAYLLTDMAKEIFSDNKREYGNGLNKFEPNDLNNSKIADLNILKEVQKNEILELYHVYRESAINQKAIKNILDVLNLKFENIYKR